jgi:nucleotide-binding universal stress UspA family protein
VALNRKGDDMYKHILVATDGSIISQKGVNHGLALAKALECKATVVIVTKPFPMEGVVDVTGWVSGENDKIRYENSQKEFAETVFGAARKSADKIGTEPDYLQVSDHSPAEGLLETAKKHDCDLIVMASHGRRGIGRLLLGSQTAEVVQSAAIPVLVVR